jgi:hypothetical protein
MSPACAPRRAAVRGSGADSAGLSLRRACGGALWLGGGDARRVVPGAGASPCDPCAGGGAGTAAHGPGGSLSHGWGGQNGVIGVSLRETRGAREASMPPAVLLRCREVCGVIRVCVPPNLLHPPCLHRTRVRLRPSLAGGRPVPSRGGGARWRLPRCTGAGEGSLGAKVDWRWTWGGLPLDCSGYVEDDSYGCTVCG